MMTKQEHDCMPLMSEQTRLNIKGETFQSYEIIIRKLTQHTLNGLKPFLPSGSITAGDCCRKNDGAVLLRVMEKTLAKAYGIHSGLSFIDQVTIGVDP